MQLIVFRVSAAVVDCLYRPSQLSHTSQFTLYELSRFRFPLESMQIFTADYYFISFITFLC